MKNLILLSLVLLVSCGIARRPNAAKVTNELNVETEAEYNYSFTEGTKFKLLNNTNQAINLFFKCIELKPGSPAPYYQLSEIYYNNGDFSRALVFSKKSVALDSKNYWYLLQLARIYQERGDIDSTIFTYKRIVKIQPSNYEVNFNLALLYYQNREPNKTLQLLKGLKQKYGNNEQIVLALFKVYSNIKDHRNCIGILKEAVAQFPDDIRFYGLLAEYYVGLGDFENALVYYNQLLAMDAGNEKGMLSLIEYYRIVKDYPKLTELSRKYIADTTFVYKNKVEIIANMIADAKFLADSSRIVLLLIQQMDSVYKSDFRVNTLYTDFYLKTKNYTLAKDKLVYLVSHYETTMPFWEQLILVLSSLNEHGNIIKYSDKGIALFGNKPFFFLYKGIAMYQLKQYQAARNVLNEGLRYTDAVSELRVQFYTFLGECANYEADYAASDSFFQHALKLDPYNLFILNNYSYYLAERGVNLPLAVNYIKICLERHPNAYSYLDTYGWILYKMGKIENSRKVLEAAIRNGGRKDKEVLEHYILVLHTLGATEAALEYYKLVTELGEPGNEIKRLFKN